MSLRKILQESGERGFLEIIRKRFGTSVPASPAGIGDDAAVVRAGKGRLLVSADCLIEDHHFRRGEPAYLLGRKSLAVNLSDIAAMGGRPAAFLLTLGIPEDLPSGFLDLFLAGLIGSARQHGVRLVGGDTSASSHGLFISMAILGRAGEGRVLARHGARPGDGIYVSGALGASAAGRLLLDRGWRPRMDRTGRTLAGVTGPRGTRSSRWSRSARHLAAAALLRHLDPRPPTRLGRLLRDKGIASAAIDLSDGFSTDLARLAEASRVGARIMKPALPIHDAARLLGPLLAVDPLDLALNGGEEYALLFTVPPGREHLLATLGRRSGCAGALLVGRVTPRRRGVVLAEASGRAGRLEPAGFDHFRGAGRRRRGR